MKRLLAARPWLTVFPPPGYAPRVNPVEGVWSRCERSLANLTAGTIDRLEALVRNWLKRPRYRPATNGGFMTETGLPPP
jgi:putative transposase